MPRQITLNPHSHIQQDVLIRRRQLVDSERSHATVSEARSRAKSILREASEQAEAIYQVAYTDGFSMGLAQSLDEVYGYLQGSAQLQAHIESSIKDDVRKALSDALDVPSLLLQLLEDWLSKAPRVTALRIVLPQRGKAQALQMARRVREVLGFEPCIQVDTGERFMLEYGEHVQEFLPSNVLNEMDNKLKQTLKALNLTGLCEELRVKSTQAWLCQLEEHKATSQLAVGDVHVSI
ncbi:HrpE/YscL family type III secretion apparatus protein [Iodobacter fluviatilis]|uniref:HrpE/YscL/FliH and V-type ATPase subunit E n=1 Tax=Iodobacter fluviatilis TaxID=537 RepID=A0A377Q643_9NEIS|nr:HrpE/YscL family type III secretion apparatus protein [Iodobacter fluviatilis]TCU80271.1 HrpE/YscL/FliH and V-type ATPase subunit E [Iodobacter fluviatilis]STQ90190.1 Oxygen-regulated invasion protein OrgB [Iodobacter fluviatilis]